MHQPSLTFFCELDSPRLTNLFSGNNVIQYLTRLNANISLGLIDLSAERAEVVKKLNRAGIPVTAWILLPKEQGYWTSLDTINETVQRYMEFKEWKTKHKLNFCAIGLDIEPRIDLLTSLGTKPFSQAAVLLKRYLSSHQFKEDETSARALIQAIRTDGYAVETYQFPTVLDERAGRSDFLAKTLGIPVLNSDREILMLYSSFIPSYGDSILWSYAPQCKAVGVGSTGGGVEIEGVPPLKTLRWIDLKRDLLLAGQVVENIYIFSLEGCVNNNYMDRLLDLDWNTQIIPPHRSAMGISLVRKIGQGLLWVLSHPMEVLLGILIGSRLISQLKKLLSRK